MKCWLEEWLDFLFPEPVEQDIDGEPSCLDESVIDFCREVDGERVYIPERYARNIPVLEPDTMTPKSADAYVRSRR